MSTYYAARDFSIGSAIFETGDVVSGSALRIALANGGGAVTTSKPKKPTTTSTNGDD